METEYEKFLQAIHESDLNLVTEMLQKNPSLASANDNEPIIQLCITVKNLEIAKVLVEHGSDPKARNSLPFFEFIRYYNSYEENPLGEFLLENGADIDAVESKYINVNEEPIFPLGIAVENLNDDAVDFLLKHGANVHNGGDYAIRKITKIGGLQATVILQLLLEYNPNVNINEDIMKYLVRNNDFFHLNIFIQQTNINLSIKNNFALVYSCYKGYKNFVEILLQNGVDVNEPRKEPLLAAASQGHDSIVELLLEKGASPHIHMHDLPDNTYRLIQNAKMEEVKQIEVINEEKRKKALEEYKNSTESKNKGWIENQCINSDNLFGDSINEEDRKDIVIFFFDSLDGKGECMTKDEIDSLISSQNYEEDFGSRKTETCLWNGPPSGYRLSSGIHHGRKIEDSPVIKLPWSGNWVRKEVLEEGKRNLNSFLLLKGEKHSIGSSFGSSQLHGQFGGEWGYDRENDIVIHVPSGDYQPDERYIVYTL